MLLPQARSEAGKFCILETESYNLVNTFRCKFNGGDENFSSTGSTDPIVHYGRFSLEGRDDTQAIPGQTLKGIYPTTTLYMILHILAPKANAAVYLRLCERRHFYVLDAGLAEDPGKL